MAKVPVYAGSGEMTVLRSLAAYGWGTWGVQWPSQMPEEEKQKIDPGDGNQWGFAYRIRNAGGRHSRRFARADMSIVAADFLPNSSTPIPGSGFSDVEDVLDELEKRTDGDAFFEKEIDRAGLGPLVPYRDFNVGDRWDLSIFGLMMDDLPITQIEEITELGQVIGWKLVFGGQLVSDNAANKRAQDDLARQIESQKREQRQQAQREAEETERKIKRERTQREREMIAQRSYIDGDFKRSMQSYADGAAKKAAGEVDLSPLQSEIDASLAALAGAGATSATLLQQLRLLRSDLDSRSGVTSKDGLVQNYFTINTKLWEQQNKIDSAQTNALGALNLSMARVFFMGRDAGVGEIYTKWGNMDRYYINGGYQVNFKPNPGWWGAAIFINTYADGTTYIRPLAIRNGSSALSNGQMRDGSPGGSGYELGSRDVNSQPPHKSIGEANREWHMTVGLIFPWSAEDYFKRKVS